MKKSNIAEIILGVLFIVCGIITIVMNTPVSAVSDGFQNICFGVFVLLTTITWNKYNKS